MIVWGIVWVVVLPLVLMVATPIILVSASFSSTPYGVTVATKYQRLWDYWKNMGIWIAVLSVLGLMLLIPILVRLFGSKPTS